MSQTIQRLSTRTRAAVSRLRVVCQCALLVTIAGCASPSWQWQTLTGTGDDPVARHESALVAHHGKIYLLGGRRTNPVSVFDPEATRWAQRSPTPIELHHVQPVSFGDAIYLIGAMTGGYPNETPVDRVLKYLPDEDRFEWSHEIPQSRRRGGAGVVVHEGQFYIVGGITNGHIGGAVPWLDRYDPGTGQWEALPDAPHSRDHIQVAVVDHSIYVFGGRRTSLGTGQVLDLTEPLGNVFDLPSGRWRPVSESLRIPTQRAGHSVFAWGDEVVVAGGESAQQLDAHNEVEAFNVRTQTWRRWPDLTLGRHGTGIAIVDDWAYTIAGSGRQGGEPELIDIERIALPPVAAGNDSSERLVSDWRPVTLSFRGPAAAETDVRNPFTDYRLIVTFTQAEQSIAVRGYYAADGVAAHSGAASGNVWQARFRPPTDGLWTYRAELRAGADVALSRELDAGEPVTLGGADGVLRVMRPASSSDQRSRGALRIDRGYFRFENEAGPWLKTGSNSPENLLAFEGFDDTYRAKTQTREGDASSEGGIHRFAAHLDDWSAGDPTWSGDRGRALIGGMNYLANAGVNSQYFLTMNLDGDGSDVWPYLDAETFDRFDCSKLDQWEILFSHMQANGLLLHVVLQETENERLLDDGDTGRDRQLYLLELIARFGHHPALVWNLGEENGPASWSPVAQNTAQRIAMASFIKANDPYDHPVLLHTHSARLEKDEILTPLLGFADIDGLSFQVDLPHRVNAELALWRKRAADSGHDWLITMDEIGPWHTGAVPDELSDDGHAGLRQHALWGSFLAGGAGVEWYFGAHYPHNDLSAEDWRTRAELWRQSAIAAEILNRLPLGDMQPCNDLTGGYCLGDPGAIYVIYQSSDEQTTLDLSETEGSFDVHWFDPLIGGDPLRGRTPSIEGGRLVELGRPPDATRDWVIVVRRQSAR